MSSAKRVENSRDLGHCVLWNLRQNTRTISKVISLSLSHSRMKSGTDFDQKCTRRVRNEHRRRGHAF